MEKPGFQFSRIKLPKRIKSLDVKGYNFDGAKNLTDVENLELRQCYGSLDAIPDGIRKLTVDNFGHAPNQLVIDGKSIPADGSLSLDLVDDGFSHWTFDGFPDNITVSSSYLHENLAKYLCWKTIRRYADDIPREFLTYWNKPEDDVRQMMEILKKWRDIHTNPGGRFTTYDDTPSADLHRIFYGDFNNGKIGNDDWILYRDFMKVIIHMIISEPGVRIAGQSSTDSLCDKFVDYMWNN